MSWFVVLMVRAELGTVQLVVLQPGPLTVKNAEFGSKPVRFTVRLATWFAIGGLGELEMLMILGGETIVVGSLNVAAADPPPDTLIANTCGELALVATFTVAVIAG